MGFFDELKKLTKPYADDEEEFDEYEDEYEETDEEYEEEPEEETSRSARREPSRSRRPAAPAHSSGSSLDSGRPSVQMPGARVSSQVVIVKPEQYENVAKIADHLMNRRAVLLNLEGTNKDAAKRLVDFLSGCAYALQGKIRKVAALAYLIVPSSVEVIGDLVEELESEGTYL